MNKHSLQTMYSAQAIAGIIQLITGEAPRVVDKGAFLEVELTAAQKTTIQKKLDDILAAKPGEVKIDLVSVAAPVIMRRFWWIPLIPAGLGFLIGRTSIKK